MGVSVPIHRSPPPFFNPPPYIHLFFLTSTPCLLIRSYLPSLLHSRSLWPTIDFARPVFSTSIHRISLSYHPSILTPLPTPPLFRNSPSIYPFLKRPLRPRLHNEISASLIVLIKAVRKELREEKYSLQQGKTRAQWCVANALVSATVVSSNLSPFFTSFCQYTHIHLTSLASDFFPPCIPQFPPFHLFQRNQHLLRYVQ